MQLHAQSEGRSERGGFLFLQVNRRIINKIYFGVNYVYTKFNPSTDLFPDTLVTRLNGLGFATVFESINADNNGMILPGIGTGLRNIVIQDTHMNAGLDIAAGRNDWGIYFRFGEVF